MQKIVIAILALFVVIGLAGGAYWYLQSAKTIDATPQAQQPAAQAAPEATTTPAPAVSAPAQESIGKSVGGRDIVAYHFGTGSKELLFVAGIHGGYEWNTTIVANDLIGYLQQHPDAVPAGEKITIIPVLNPDGLAKVTDNPASFTAADIVASQATQIAGRFNANTVDLNRNFDCDWQASGVWQSKTVSGGSAAFSEPESQALKTYVEGHSIAAAVVWYSSAGGVYASNCHDGVLPETTTLMNAFATASGYPAHASFDFYATTGDAVNWLAKQKIPAISVLLTNHTDPEWDKNLKGVQAVLVSYASQ